MASSYRRETTVTEYYDTTDDIGQTKLPFPPIIEEGTGGQPLSPVLPTGTGELNAGPEMSSEEAKGISSSSSNFGRTWVDGIMEIKSNPILMIMASYFGSLVVSMMKLTIPPHFDLNSMITFFAYPIAMGTLLCVIYLILISVSRLMHRK